MKINANCTGISVVSSTSHNSDYISFTDLAKYRNHDNPTGVIANLMRNRKILLFYSVR